MNLALKELYLAHPWPYRKRTGNLLLIPNYKTGTCAVTQFTGANESAARTVVFSGAALTAQMQGRFLQVEGSSHWHRIVNDPSAGTAYLDAPITDIESAGGLTFKIWKRFYYIKSDAVSVLGFRKTSGGRIDFKASQILEREVSNIESDGIPYNFSDYGVDQYVAVYGAGTTISIPANSAVVTGVGSEFLLNVDSGDILTVDTVDYRVLRVESDTRLILHNYNGDTPISGASYEVKKDNPLGYQFYYSGDDYMVVSYDYLARAYDMINENEERPPMPEDFDKAILSRAESLYLKDKKDPNWTAVLQLYAAELDGKKISNEPALPAFHTFSPSIPSSIRGNRT